MVGAAFAGEGGVALQCLPTSRGTVGLVTRSRRTKDALSQQMFRLIGDMVELCAASVEEDDLQRVVPAKVVVASSQAVAQLFERYTGISGVIVGRRTVYTSQLEALLQIPRGTRVLVVSDMPEAAADTIRLLRSLGFGYLELFPYWPGLGGKHEPVDMAITPGLPELVPDDVTGVVDIGTRPLDLTTIFEILKALGIGPEGIEAVCHRYLHGAVEVAARLVDLIRQRQGFEQTLKAVVEAVADGLLVTDETGIVELANRGARTLFSLESGLPGCPLDELLPVSAVRGTVAIPAAEGTREATVYRLRGRSILVGKIPLDGGKLLLHLQDAHEVRRLGATLRAGTVEERYAARYSFDDIVACSPPMRRVVALAKRVASSDFCVLITGESGTGKELLAHAIHNASRRSKGPFVPVNITALPEALCESELFGYEEGAFTGARRGGKPGLFEQASGGTLFLDEIGDAPPSVQARLLRVLQEKEVMRVGATRLIPVDVRVICATNTDLKRLMSEGRFRPDLYYRIAALTIEVPRLRDRVEDIPLLAQRFAARMKKRIASDAMEHLKKYPWPGNVRELLNVVQYAAVVSDDEWIRAESLPRAIRDTGGEANGIDTWVDRMKTELEEHGPLEDFLAILSLLSKGGGGRRSLAAALESQRQLSEGKVRLRLQVLARLGLISVRRGPRGCFLTGRGRAFMEEIMGN